MNEVRKDSQPDLFSIGQKIGLTEQNVKDIIYLFGTNALGDSKTVREDRQFGDAIRHTTPDLTAEVLKKAMDDEFLLALWNHAMNMSGTRGHGREDKESPRSLQLLKAAQKRFGDKAVIKFAKARLKVAIRALKKS